MNIESFDELIALACREKNPAMLLTCVLRRDSMVAAGAASTRPDLAGEGVLRPVMVKAHEARADLSFEKICAEVEQGEHGWTFIMLAVLPGFNGRQPAAQQVDEQLKNMARVMHTGSGLDKYLFIDRQGDFVRIDSDVLAG